MSDQPSCETVCAEELARGLLAMGIELNESAQYKLMQLLALLHKWNRVYNLTAIRDPEAMVSGHLLDSLVLLSYLPSVQVNGTAATDDKAGATLDRDKNPLVSADATLVLDKNLMVGANKVVNSFDVMDVGSGAGLPVLPLAIARPDLRFLSVESNGKKTRFQQQAILELGIDNVRIVNQRIENINDVARIVTARAFTAPEKFLDIATSLVQPGGQVLMMLGRADRMPPHLKKPFSLVSLLPALVPGIDAPRHVAVCQRGTRKLV